jgi:hypothetical protein
MFVVLVIGYKSEDPANTVSRVFIEGQFFTGSKYSPGYQDRHSYQNSSR